MKDSDTLLIVIGLYLLSRGSKIWSETIEPAAKRAGVKAYEAVHNDPGHIKDVPKKPLTKKQLVDLARSVGFPDPNMAAAIALAESGGVPNAKGDFRNGEFWSWGLWQINIKAHPIYGPEGMVDPERNAQAAFAISKGGTNWRPWSVFKSGRYKGYL